MVKVGRSANIICSKDVTKLEIKLNRRHAKMANFSEWGIAELALTEVPGFPDYTEGAPDNNGPVGGEGALNGEAAAREFWLPVTRRSSGEQIGVILVEAQRQRVDAEANRF